MNVFISADIEGTCGICAWDETEPQKNGYDYFRRQMSEEVSAACRGALSAGAERVLVKDAHYTARNIDPAMLPQEVQLNRGWSHDGYCMMSGIQRGDWDAAVFTGYHSAGSSAGNPLSHTMSTEIDYVEINGQRASEFMINAYMAAYHNVPVCFVSGDAALCESARRMIPSIAAVPVNKGDGDSVTSLHPQLAVERIEDVLREQLDSGKYLECILTLPTEFEFKIRYKKHQDAAKAALYPNMTQLDEKTVRYNCFDYFDAMCMMEFVL